MTEITEEKAIEVYNKHHLEAENYLAQYGDDGISRNIGVTQSYNHMSEQAPLFMWFHAATTGSFQVGEALQLTQNSLVQSCHSTQTMFEGLSWGNQAIHNNMFALLSYSGLGANSVPSSMSADISLSGDGDYLLNITSYYNTGECDISYEYEYEFAY